MKKLLKNIAAILFGTLIAVTILEIFLHIYNPFKTRLSGKKITLPVNQKYEFDHVKFHGLDQHIIHTKNEYGFRGPLPNQVPGYKYKVFFIGGSTTECYYLSDGKDWPAVCAGKLNSNGNKIWYNNAGLDGHSTNGHCYLLMDHIIGYQPNYVFFLVGANDVATNGLNRFENAMMGNKKRFLQNFELYNLYLNFKLTSLAKKRGVAHTAIDFAHLNIVDTSDAKTAPSFEKELIEYKRRLNYLEGACRTYKITPVFISQPCLLKPGIDPMTQLHTSSYPFAEHSGLYYYRGLEQYNNTTRQFCERRNVYFIDAAKLMPSSSEYYYDYFHYTNAGAAKLGQIIADEIKRQQIIPLN